MKRFGLLILILLGLFIEADAQRRNNNDYRFRQRQRRAPSLSVGVQVGDPSGQFGFTYDGYPAGLAGQFLLNSGRSPIEFGVSGAWQAMGSTDRDIDIYHGEDAQGDGIWSEGSMRVSSNTYTYHGIVRLKPFAGNFQVYGDLLGGMKSFSTRSTIEEDNGGYTEVIDQQRDHRDFALSYGWAAGMKIALTDYIMLEGRFEKLNGGETTFIDPDSIVIGSEGNLEYSEIQSKTDLMVYQIGVSFEF